MKRCLIVTTIDNTINSFLLPHIKLLINKGITVDIACNVTDKPNKIAQVINGDLYSVPFSRKMLTKNNAKSFFMVKKLLNNKKYNFIHVHTPIASFITRIAASKKSKIIYTAHGFHINENNHLIENNLYYSLEKIAAYKGNDLIVINEYDYTIAKKLSNNRIYMVNGVGLDTEKYSKSRLIYDNKNSQIKEKLLVNPEKIIITHIAEFNDNKRQLDIIKAVEILKNNNQNFIVLLIGKGQNWNWLNSLIKEKNLEEYIKLLGYREDIPDLLNLTDIGLLVSIREGLPRSVMEMMSMEIPMVVSEIRGNIDLINDEVEGFQVPIKSPKLIAEKLLILINNKSLREVMGTNARNKIIKNFSLEKILKDMDDIYSNYI